MADYTWMLEKPIRDYFAHYTPRSVEAFPRMAARLTTAFSADIHENPGHDATPAYCALCEEDFSDEAPAVDTSWGPMHGDCVDSHEEEVE